MNQRYPGPEILAPAGNLEKFRTALLYGANAVYLGGETLNLRASSPGLDHLQLRQAVSEAKSKNTRVYYCLNSFPGQADLRLLPEVIEQATDCGISAFIIADPGVLRLARRYSPQIPLHLSTQANTTNSQSVLFWLEQGVSRINLARELGWREIGEIRAACPEAELEVFLHGAMCLALSGQCLLSAWLNGRPANRGQCTQPCRFDYKAQNLALVVEEALRPGLPLWEVREEENYSSFWAPDDLCLLPYLPWFINQGIDSLKIEGRMKSAAYVAHVTDVYCSALKAARRFAARPGQSASNPAAVASGRTSGSSTLPDREAELLRDLAPTAAPEELETYDYWPFLAELLQNSARPLSSGFFFPDRRINLTRLAEQRGLPAAGGKHSGVLARVLEPCGGASAGQACADQADWVIEVKENWHNGQAVQLMLPGLNRPLLKPQGYVFENHRGETSAAVLCGTRAVLRLTDAALRDLLTGSAQAATEKGSRIQPGIFIRRAPL